MVYIVYRNIYIFTQLSFICLTKRAKYFAASGAIAGCASCVAACLLLVASCCCCCCSS